MSVPTREEAWRVLCEHNKEAFHLHHARTVEAVMRWFANDLGYSEEADFWATVGLLHDLDFEEFPGQHCEKTQEMMRAEGWDLRPATATACARRAPSPGMRWKKCFLRVTSSRD